MTDAEAVKMLREALENRVASCGDHGCTSRTWRDPGEAPCAACVADISTLAATAEPAPAPDLMEVARLPSEPLGEYVCEWSWKMHHDALMEVAKLVREACARSIDDSKYPSASAAIIRALDLAALLGRKP